MSEKNHYRKVMKSDHLGVADLEDFIESGRSLIFKIANSRQEYRTLVAGRKIDANIIYFDDAKPMVVNSTNSKTLSKLAGSPFVEDWSGLLIELYIDRDVRMKGETVGGIRIKNRTPKVTLEIMSPDHPRWSEAKQRVADGMSQQELSKFYQVNVETWGLLCQK